MFIYITFFKKGLYFHQAAIVMHTHADKQTAMQHWVFHQRCLHISPGLWPVHTSVEPTRKYTNRGLERWLKASWYQPVQTHSNPASWPRLTDLSLTAQKQPEADQESALQPWPEIWEGDPSITASSFIHSIISFSHCFPLRWGLRRENKNQEQAFEISVSTAFTNSNLKPLKTIMNCSFLSKLITC